MGLTPLRLRDRRGMRGREAFWFYIILAGALLILDMTGSRIPREIRAYANDLAAPVLNLLDRPVRAIQAGLERVAGVSDIYLENETLRDENGRLRQWREAALQLSRENERLRQMLKVPGREVPPAATARVIGIGGGAFERSILINAGAKDGVLRDQPVVDDSGVVGRAIQVGHWTSRVLLVTDLNSRIPVRLERSGIVGIAEGQNETLLRLRFLPKEADVKVGDRVLTSGQGGIFPPDLPVGKVVSIDGEFIMLEPLGMLGKLDYVRVMAYVPVPAEDKSLLESQDGGRR
ncbi:rod shape-determining protein MreC [Kordiimonas marina]|uniref:rod shape-determining protein MreC n=1 Tax=Kordiimonas marina TaxID=2872312 RepID=UPI001FF2C96D|nr:rod shape-determining protein MreC [Kordiimonas marina]MCJ9427464.1 rod shape-determining protein MreC [Kordiimonas marina]